MFKDLDSALLAGTAPSYFMSKFFGENPPIFVGISRMSMLDSISPSSNILANNNGFRMLPVLLGAVITLPMGFTSAKEYAELEWPIDILLTVVWVLYGVLFFGTIMKRKTPHIYVANWFFGAYIITVADSYDAMTSDRPYRKGMKKEVAIEEIKKNLGAQFNPLPAQAMIELFEEGKV